MHYCNKLLLSASFRNFVKMATTVPSQRACRLSIRYTPHLISTRSNVLFDVKERFDILEGIPHRMRKAANSLHCDMDGFTGNFSKRWPVFEKKEPRNAYYKKVYDERVKEGLIKRVRDRNEVMAQYHSLSKSNIRRARKAQIKEPEIKDISPSEASSYLSLLERIRDGVRNPKNKEIIKSPADVVINEKRVRKYLKKISALNIVPVIHVHSRSDLPIKRDVDAQCDALELIHSELTKINNKKQRSDDRDGERNGDRNHAADSTSRSSILSTFKLTANSKSDSTPKQRSVLHLDLYSELLLSFGRIGRIHRMMAIYKELKLHHLMVTNATIIEMLEMAVDDIKICKQLWTEYLNDFRKGKIPERPTLELFNAFMAALSVSRISQKLFEVQYLFKMMTDEFHIAPDLQTMEYLLRSYKYTAPPRYKSAQKLFRKMRDHYGLKPGTTHYALMLSIISTKWGHFNKFYCELEDVDNDYLARFKNGIDFQRSWRVFHTVWMDTECQIQSDLIAALLKAARNTNKPQKERLELTEWIFRKFVLLESEFADDSKSEYVGTSDSVTDSVDDTFLRLRFPEISTMKIEGDICVEMLRICFLNREWEKGKQYYLTLTQDERIRHRFVPDGFVFGTLIDGIMCDVQGHVGNQMDEMLVMDRMQWVESEMEKCNVIENVSAWDRWLFLGRRSKNETVINRILEKMDDSMNNIKYIELNVELLQSVVEVLCSLVFCHLITQQMLSAHRRCCITTVKWTKHWNIMDDIILRSSCSVIGI